MNFCDMHLPDSNFSQKSLFGVAYMTSEYAITKMVNFVLFFSDLPLETPDVSNTI